MIKQNRMRSIYVYLSIFASAFLAVGIDWHTFTSWQLLGQEILKFLANPSMIIAFAINLYGILNNPTNKTGF